MELYSENLNVRNQAEEIPDYEDNMNIVVGNS
jgi:hypothetical protein